MKTATEKNNITPLVKHDLALKVYLDSLLFEDVAEVPSKEVAAEVAAVDVVKQAAEVLSVPQTEVVVDQPLPSLPEWGKQPFESLLFTVGGFLTLAIPLDKLNGIVEWPGLQFSALPEHSEWFLGVVSHRGKQVKVIDIAKFVIPENHKARAALKADRLFGHIILIMNGEYGLVCDGLGEVLKLTANDVRWRDGESARPWLAGTVTEKMCAMLDIDHFSEMLKLESG